MKQVKSTKSESFKYRCNKCGSRGIYLSVTIKDKEGTLSCLNCGETDDARYGITKEPYEQAGKSGKI